MDRLETERLLLRPFVPDDAVLAHRVYSDPEVMRYVATGPLADRNVTERLLYDYDLHQRTNGYSFWAVIERSSGDLIGDGGLYRTPAGEVELGYTLGVPWWGRGYATEIANVWLDTAFGPLDVDEVVALAEPANTASLHVLEKVGMQRTGERIAFGRPHLVFRRGRVAEDAQFSYRETKEGGVLVSWRGRVVTRLAGRKARALLNRVRGASAERVQLELTRVTGNFKRGNERR